MGDKTKTGEDVILSTSKCGVLQLRPRRKDGWSPAKRQIFLDHLAATCNISMSARAAGKDPSSVRALRTRDAAFAEQWDEALETGYAAMETMLLERASGPASIVHAPNDGDSPDILLPEISDMDSDLAVRLLSLRRKNADPRSRRKPYKRVSASEVDAAIVKRLKALHARMIKEGRSAAGLGID